MDHWIDCKLQPGKCSTCENFLLHGTTPSSIDECKEGGNVVVYEQEKVDDRCRICESRVVNPIIILPDGSHMHVNTKSKIKRKNNRRLI